MQHKKLTADKSPKVTVTEKPSKINHSGRDRLNPMKHTGPEANVFNYHFPYPPSAEMHEVFHEAAIDGHSTSVRIIMNILDDKNPKANF